MTPDRQSIITYALELADRHERRAAKSALTDDATYHRSVASVLRVFAGDIEAELDAEETA